MEGTPAVSAGVFWLKDITGELEQGWIKMLKIKYSNHFFVGAL